TASRRDGGFTVLRELIDNADGARGLFSAQLWIGATALLFDGARGIALAGVMGGLDTEVTGKTTRILLESAAFAGKMIRKTSRRLALRSEASLRFERGIDAELASLASARAARLLCEHAGGHVVGDLVDAYPGQRPVPAISLRLARVQLVSGVKTLDGAACRDALERLGCTVVGAGATFDVTPLSARPDLAREIDLIEEILRVTGYEHVPSTLPMLHVAPPLQELDRADVVRRALAAAGLAEAITFGFQSVERNASLGLAATDLRSQPITLRNPMSLDQAVMRTSLLPNLVAAITRNQSFGRPDVAIFEAGSVFLRRDQGGGGGPIHGQADEPTWVCGVLAGHRPGHLGDGTAWDALDAKSFALVAIRAIAGDRDVQVRAIRDVAYLHPGVGGELVIERGRVGVFGELHPAMRSKLGVTGAAFVFEVDLTKLGVAGPTQMKPITKFPASSRDVSLLLAEAIPAGAIETAIRATHEPLVDRIRLLEDYRDAKLPPGQKSMLWSISYRAPDRTLTDVEVDKAHEGIVGRLVENLPAQRR
ncbi:MAG: phenylalanine--tRNA ligase subunit beta, partial [Proteobacteria bacterium]|nr:phenylalanine--tRNA ligase subunit beta [Pseudomonadota bacterium]